MILFLDDQQERHIAFRSRCQALNLQPIQVYTAQEAIDMLWGDHGFTHVFLDHDLSEEDILVRPGQPTKVPTGMDVVDHIVKMKILPKRVTVHSMNYDAAVEMCTRLAALRTMQVDRIPFHILIQRFFTYNIGGA